MSGSRFDTLIGLMACRARKDAGKAAFLFDRRSWTFGDIWQHVNGFGACLLNRGVTPGDRVVLALPNGPDFFVAFYGVCRWCHFL